VCACACGVRVVCVCVCWSLGLPGASSWCLLCVGASLVPACLPTSLLVCLCLCGFLFLICSASTMFIVGVAFIAAIAQLGERQTEDLKVPGSILGLGTFQTDRAVCFAKTPQSHRHATVCRSLFVYLVVCSSLVGASYAGACGLYLLLWPLASQHQQRQQEKQQQKIEHKDKTKNTTNN